MSQIDDPPHDGSDSPATARATGGEPVVAAASTPRLRQCYAAFLRDLPALLEQYPGQWAAYAGDQRLRIGVSKRDLYRQCIAAGHREGEFLICGIEKPQRVVLDDLLEV